MSTQSASPFTVALIDLDGTIIDSASGITATLAFTLEELDIPVPPPEQLLGFVGPPIMDGFRDVVGMTDAQAATALHIYRARYQSHGAFDSIPYDGIREALDQLGSMLPLAVATSKPERQAKRILHHFGLDDRFIVIAGASEDEVRSEKADVITWALKLLREAGVDVSRPVMIGDRSHDVHGAATHGIPAIFAEWGYGSPAEASGTIAIAARPGELPGLLRMPSTD